ncbi:MAG: GNAT family N-acetyltransferase [Caulobacteraceae bacterium]|nr:GNAT family N-acetyltransferase [Caulobacter sp.]
MRGLSDGDAAGLGELLADCGRPVDAPRMAERVGRLRRADGAALVALEWGPPSGVAAAHWAPDLLEDAPVARLDLVLVHPQARRRGVGRLLLKAVAQAARQGGCRELRVAPPVGDAELRAFFLASGFEPAACGWARPLRRRG